MSLDVRPSDAAFPTEWEITRSSTWRDRSRKPRRRFPLAATLALLAAVLGGLLAGYQPLVGLAVLVVVPIVFVVTQRPDAVTVAVIALVYANAPVILTQHGVPSIAASLVPLALVIPLVHRILLKGEALSLPSTLPLMLLFGATQLTSALAAPDLTFSLIEVFGFATEGLALFVLVTASITTTRLLRQVLWAIVLSGAFLGFLSLFQQLTGTFSFNYFGFAQVSDAILETESTTGTTTNSEGKTGLARLAGPIGEKNRYAQILVVLVPVALGLMKNASRRGTVVLLACIVCHVAGIVLTYSRGAVVGLVFALVLAALLRLVPLRAVVALLVAGALVVAIFPTYRERVTSLAKVTTGGQAVNGQTADGSIQSRQTEMLAAMLALREHPLTGVGPGQYPREYVSYAQRVGGRAKLEARESHNLYLGIAADLGFPGIIAFLLVVGAHLKGLWRSRRLGRAARGADPGDAEAADDRLRAPLASGLLVALSTYLATGFFLHLSYQRYFWLLVALCAVAAPLHRERRPDAAEQGPARAPSPA